jgi:hypothetical protein
MRSEALHREPLSLEATTASEEASWRRIEAHPLVARVAPMKTAFRTALGAMALPLVLFGAKVFLEWAFSCSGMDHVEHCDVEAGRGIVAAIVGSIWISAPLLPLGFVALLILGSVRWVRMDRGQRR